MGRREVRALTAAVQGGDPFEGGRRQGDRDGPGGGIEPGRREGYRDAATVGRDDDGGGREPRAGRARVAQDLRGRGLQCLQDRRLPRNSVGDRGLPLISSRTRRLICSLFHSSVKIAILKHSLTVLHDWSPSKLPGK